MMLALLVVAVILARLFDEVPVGLRMRLARTPGRGRMIRASGRRRLFRLGLTMMRRRRRWIVGR
jgi:hypothetical protein